MTNWLKKNTDWVIGFFAIVLVAFVITMAVSCKDKSDPTPVPLPPASVSNEPLPESPVLVEGGSWSLVMPPGWIREEDLPGSFKAVKKGESLKLTFKADAFKGTFEEQTLLTIQGVKQNGGIVTSFEQTKVNEFPWNVILATREDVMLIQYTTVKDKVAYNLYCGGPANTDDCHMIAKSIKIK